MSQTTQARIFAAARALFDQNGVEGVSMRRIADKVGITPMAIYRHYPDKDALLNALMLDGFAAWEARVEKIREPEPLGWLQVMGEAFLDFALGEPRRYPGDFVAGRSPVVSKFMARVEEARARGLIVDVPTIDITIHFTALTQGLVEMYRAGRFAGEAEFRDAYRKALGQCIRSFMEKHS